MSDEYWQGFGWYRIGYSDGGQDFTNDGPVWYESYYDLEEDIDTAQGTETDIHLAYAEYLGDGDKPTES